MNESLYQEVIDQLLVLMEDVDASKIFKDKAKSSIDILKSGVDLAVDKVLLNLEDLNNHDLSSYHRTQLWDIISMLESLKN